MWPLEGGQNKRKYQSSLGSEMFRNQILGGGGLEDVNKLAHLLKLLSLKGVNEE